MEILLPLVVGILYAAGLFLMLHRSFVKLVIGMGILGHATNLFLFVVSRVTRATPPLIAEGEKILQEPFADPVPQALILTAIVIGFAVQAFAIVLYKSVYHTTKTGDLDKINTTDRIDAYHQP